MEVSMLASAFEIAGRPVGGDAPCFVIAEAGVAHFGDYGKALALVDMACNAGADAVKFQVFDVERMIAAEGAEWRKRMRSRSLAREAFRDIKGYCDDKGIIFFATAHEEDSFGFVESLNPPVHKIGSGELRNWAYLRRIAEAGRPVIFSTGMYEIEEVSRALDEMTGTGNRDIAVLQCTTRYPTPPKEANLRVMDLYHERFGGVVGYSDHTQGFHISLAAVARGAKVVEKHISIDFDVPDAQDWKVSCGPHDLVTFITQLREIEQALGSSEKKLSKVERDSVAWARKSLVAAHAIPAGTVISVEMLTSKRPGTGIAPDEIANVAGRETRVDIEKDEVLGWGKIK